MRSCIDDAIHYHPGAGINHNAWFTELRYQGQDMYPRLRDLAREPEIKEPVREQMLQKQLSFSISRHPSSSRGIAFTAALGDRVAPEARALRRERRSQVQRSRRYADFLQNPFRGQASRQEHHRQAGAGVRAAADKVKVAVPVVPVVWPQVAYL